MIRNVCLLILIFFSTQGKGQIYDSLSGGSVKLDIINFADNFPSLMVSVEHKLVDKLYLHHEGGWVLPIINYRQKEISGFKLREELRYYPVSWGVNDFYLGVDGRYTQENIHEPAIVGYKCLEGQWGGNQCEFYQEIDGPYRKELFAFGIRWGLRHSFYPLFFEYDTGFAYAVDKVVAPNNPYDDPDYELVSRQPFRINRQGEKLMFSIRAKLGYYIGR